MMARPTDCTETGVSAAALAAAETPLQRQILLWQMELMRRAAAAGLWITNWYAQAVREMSD